MSSDVMKANLRKLITGDERKRIRDLIRDKKKEPAWVLLLDKLAFTFGVLNIGTTQFFLLSKPEYFSYWYCFVIPAFMILRIREFKKRKYQYFLIDFCYFVLACTFLFLFFFQWSARFFKVVFIFANGPLALAIIVWRCSLVFHDREKNTSVYIHILPSMLFYCLRWKVLDCSSKAYNLDSLDYVNASFLYIVWQGAYFLKTEIVDKKKLDMHPELITSLRWLSSDSKNATAKAVLSILRKLRVFKFDEVFDSSMIKTKVVFMGTQFLYTLMTFVTSIFVYHSETVNLVYICVIFTLSVYYGACYYIDIFSKRYQLQFEKQEDMQIVAQVKKFVALHFFFTYCLFSFFLSRRQLKSHTNWLQLVHVAIVIAGVKIVLKVSLALLPAATAVVVAALVVAVVVAAAAVVVVVVVVVVVLVVLLKHWYQIHHVHQRLRPLVNI